jgi:hypothetical protein
MSSCQEESGKSHAQSPESRRLFTAAFAVLIALFVINVIPRLGRWSGDALIHLSLAERFAEGRPFEFNAGEVISGSTSLGWTLLEAAILRGLGVHAAVYGMPICALGALLGAAGLVYGIALRRGAARPAAALAALAFMAVPGVLYNGVLPMEASLFAAVALGFALSLELGAGAARPSPFALSAALLAAAILLRPEGVLLAALPFVAAPSKRRALGIVLGAALAVLPAALAHHAATGLWTPGSAVARVMAARRAGLPLHLGGPVWIYGDVLARLAAYLPLTALGLAGARGGDPLGRRLQGLIFGGLALYTFVTGASHVARLSIWIFAALAALAPAAAARLAESSPRGRAVVIAGGALFLAVAGAETIARARIDHQVHGGATPAEVLAERAARRETTDAMLAALCSGGCCRPDRPASIALTEVQVRWALDDRIAVVSLDGRTRALSTQGGPRVSFQLDGCVEIEDTLRDPAVTGVLERPTAGPRCALGETGSALAARWGEADETPAGWRWNEALGGVVRVCSAR